MAAALVSTSSYSSVTSVPKPTQRMNCRPGDRARPYTPCLPMGLSPKMQRHSNRDHLGSRPRAISSRFAVAVAEANKSLRVTSIRISRRWLPARFGWPATTVILVAACVSSACPGKIRNPSEVRLTSKSQDARRPDPCDTRSLEHSSRLGEFDRRATGTSLCVR